MAENVTDTTIQSFLNSRGTANSKGVLTQAGLSIGLSVVTLLAFSFFRPRQTKVYAPKVKYGVTGADQDYDPPPPSLPSGFFAWLSPVLHLKEQQMIANIGLDATAFLRMLRMLLKIFAVISVWCAVLMIMFGVYNAKSTTSTMTDLSVVTIQNVKADTTLGSISNWCAVAASYIVTFTVMGFVWYNWRVMVLLRHKWFLSPAYQTKVYSRTIMVTNVPKEYRSDEGLVHLLGQLKVDGIKIAAQIESSTAGRRIGDFPKLVDDHNDAVKDLEHCLVKYLKGGQMASKRPTLRKGGIMCCGGKKVDAIDYYAKQIKFLHDNVEERRSVINSLLKKERKARKGGARPPRVEGENYGFVTFRTIAEAHRIARTHAGKAKELGGAQLQLAPMPHDIIWDNLRKEPVELASARSFGFFLLGGLFIVNVVPLALVSFLSALSSFAAIWTWLGDWLAASKWSFALVTGALGPILSTLFSLFLPALIRRICKYQGAVTRSRLDRATTARYFFFMLVWYLILFTLMGALYNIITGIIKLVGKKSALEILKSFEDIPELFSSSYINQSTYWLTWLPLRGFLVIFDLIQLLKLALVSLRRVMFSYTPRDIRDLTKPPYFDYHVVSVNILFIAAVGLVYAPIGPLVTIGATLVFWFSLVVYKYQLLYVYVSRAESGGRMWNVYCNRLLWGVLLMQLLMVLTTGLIRDHWLDAVAAAPPVLILAVFKVYMANTIERKFTYYQPTPEEVQASRSPSMDLLDKKGKLADIEKSFLHPALLQDKLYKIMVHKSQEALAREVLSAYPWFAGKHQHDGVEIRAVREENLEYDPARDGPVEERAVDWDARSIATTLDLDSATNAAPSVYAMSSQPSFNKGFNRSTDELLADPAPQGVMGSYNNSAVRLSEDGPLLDPWERQNAGVPYPPSASRVGPSAYSGSAPQYTAEPQGYENQQMYGRPRNGSQGSLLDQYGQPAVGGGGGGRPRNNSQGSVNMLEQYGSMPQRSRNNSQGSVNLLDHHAPRPRNGSQGSMDQFYSQPVRRQESGGGGGGGYSQQQWQGGAGGGRQY